MKVAKRKITVMSVLGVAGLGVVGLWMMAFSSLRPDYGTSMAARKTDGAEPLGQFSLLPAPRPAPELTVDSLEGATVTLSSFRGRPVLLNLWATWCAPCIEEMPSLDRLQQKLGSDLVVLAISEDRRGAEVVRPFREKLRLSALELYLDPADTAVDALSVEGLPTSVLIDRAGNMVGIVKGSAAWDSPDMVALLQRYLDAPRLLPQRAAAGP